MATTAPNRDFVLAASGATLACEYRRYPYDPNVLFLECRLLKLDGTPHDNRWYPVSDAHLTDIQWFAEGREIVKRLSQLGPEQCGGEA